MVSVLVERENCCSCYNRCGRRVVGGALAFLEVEDSNRSVEMLANFPWKGRKIRVSSAASRVFLD